MFDPFIVLLSVVLPDVWLYMVVSLMRVLVVPSLSLWVGWLWQDANIVHAITTAAPAKSISSLQTLRRELFCRQIP